MNILSSGFILSIILGGEISFYKSAFIVNPVNDCTTSRIIKGIPYLKSISIENSSILIFVLSFL